MDLILLRKFKNLKEDLVKQMHYLEDENIRKELGKNLRDEIGKKYNADIEVNKIV